MKYLFTCGGTAGHINPAIAVASRLKNWDNECEILFIGAEGKMEMELVPREGYEIRGIQITNISREKSLAGIKHNLKTIKNVLASSAAAKKIIAEFQPDVVIGTGGYVCFPVIEAAHRMNIPTVIHESNAHPGLTTRLLSRMVDRVLVGLEGCAQAYPDPKRVIVTGTPVRGTFRQYTPAEAKQALGLKTDEKLVLSVWGSLGAGHMNEIMLSLIPLKKKNAADFHLIHVTGKRYYQSFMERLKASVPDYAQYGVEIREYLHDMPCVMTAADLVMCRAGASTLSELSYMGKPSLLVPSPNVVENHQEKNARVLEQAGAAQVLLEGEFTADSLLDRLSSVLADEIELQKMSSASASLCYEDAAEKIADIVLQLAKD